MTWDIMIANYDALLVQTVELLNREEISNVTFNQTINCEYPHAVTFHIVSTNYWLHLIRNYIKRVKLYDISILLPS